MQRRLGAGRVPRIFLGIIRPQPVERGIERGPGAQNFFGGQQHQYVDRLPPVGSIAASKALTEPLATSSRCAIAAPRDGGCR